jgi:hypothetical protein
MFPDQQIEHQKTAPAEKGPYENQTGFDNIRGYYGKTCR